MMNLPGDDEDDEALALPDDEESDVPQGAPAGPGDDDGGDEAREAAAEAESEEAEERVKPSRATRAVQQAKQAAREANERAARVEQELQALRRERESQQQRQQPQEETEEQFNARLSLMDLEQRIDAKRERAERRHQIALQQMQQQTAIAQFRAADAADKAAYDSQAASDARWKKYAPDVEAALAQARQMGNWGLDRRTVLAYVVGQKVLAAKAEVSKAKQQGQDNIRRQQARTNGGTSDRQAPPRRRTYAPDDMSLEAVRARLEGQLI